MKKLICGLSVLFGLAMASSCSQYADDPKIVAQHFMEAVKKTDFEEAKKYATKNSRDMIDLLASITHAVPQAKEKIQEADISIKDVAINDDKAVVTYVNTKDNKEETLNMKKEDGKWKVVFTKENYLQNPGEANPIKDSLNTLLPGSK